MRACIASLLFLAGAALTNARAQQPAATFTTDHLGPSFACPVPRDPLGQLICSSAALSQLDLRFVQTFQALRQQLNPAQQQSLRVEAVAFSKTVRDDCGIAAPAGPNAPPPPAPGPEASECVEHDYARQRDAWRTRLSGVAAEEADRDIEQQVMLQRDLLQLGLLPQSEPADGVYGNRTRLAILAFQQTMGLPQTGLLGNADAVALSRQVARPVPSPTPARTAWDNFLSEATAAGLNATFATAGPCIVTVQIRDPAALRNAVAESVRSNGGALPEGDAARLFASEVEFLRTYLAAHAVQAFYATELVADVCRFDTVAFTTDVYGRDVAQPLFAFQFDRSTYGKVVWSRFDPANMPKIVAALDYSAYAKQRLRAAGDASTDTPTPAIAAPVPQPPPRPAHPTVPVSNPADPPAAGMPVQQAMTGQGGVVVRWSGSTTMITRPFHVDGAWEFAWSNEGAFTATLHRLGSDKEQTLAFATKPAASSAYQPNGGDFYIEFSAMDDWSASVQQLPPG